MNTLRSKIQFKNFEKGEFGEICERTLEQTLQLMHDFPWDRERTLASVELTCPSVTIEHQSGSFLKLGPYFGGKFCFYHCSAGRKVTYKIINELFEIDFVIAAYFNGDGTVQGFQTYTFVINPLRHFKTDPFEYQPGAKAVIKHLVNPVFLYGILIIFVATKFFSDWSILLSLTGSSIFLGFFLLYCGPSLYLFFNYLKGYEGQYLKISRGHQRFIFGDASGKKEYDKADIIQITKYYHHARRSPWRESMIYTIKFKDGALITFSSLLIIESAFNKKFPDIEVDTINKAFPTVDSVKKLQLA